jgi:hypothetical protein
MARRVGAAREEVEARRGQKSEVRSQTSEEDEEEDEEEDDEEEDEREKMETKCRTKLIGRTQSWILRVEY